MAKFKIKGGIQLNGSITPQGCKNEAFQILCATLLTKEPVTIHNLPNILDIRRMLDILAALGVNIKHKGGDSYELQAADIDIQGFQKETFYKYFTAIRGALLITGPILARLGMTKVIKPGGDKIGRRHLDTHIIGLTKLGATYAYDHENREFVIKAKKLIGNNILLEEPSVTGTANIVMAACLAEGTTTIYNAACEPHIQQLCKMLVSMGAKINGIGSNFLIIEGVTELHGTTHTISPDILEIGSFIGLAAMTMSDITVNNVDQARLGQIPEVFEKIGINLNFGADSLRICPQETYRIAKNIDGSILKISDGPWPNVPADLISIIITASIQAQGVLLIHQKMYESRLFFVDMLIEMGAQIILCDPHRVAVVGLNRQHHLKSILATSPDIRAGIALLIAALSAKGTSTIENIEQIERGYSNIEKRLTALGADIERID
jgi:UDP-N-acetylglucosamine 1-carboxyvinyltransferase